MPLIMLGGVVEYFRLVRDDKQALGTTYIHTPLSTWFYRYLLLKYHFLLDLIFWKCLDHVAH